MQSSIRYIRKKKKTSEVLRDGIYAALIFSPCPIDEIVSWWRHELTFVSPPSFCFMYNWAFWKDSKCHLCLSVPRHRVRRGKAKWRYSFDAWIYSKNKETGLFFSPTDPNTVHVTGPRANWWCHYQRSDATYYSCQSDSWSLWHLLRHSVPSYYSGWLVTSLFQLCVHRRQDSSRDENSVPDLNLSMKK